jgi:hypothetical protein
MALVPKLPDISKASLQLIRSEFREQKNEKNQLFPKINEHLDQKIKYTSELLKFFNYSIYNTKARLSILNIYLSS